MSLEIRALGVKCNLQCVYCYQDSERESSEQGRSYDLEKIKAAIEAEGGGPFGFFGGEPLLLPIRDLQELASWGHEKYGMSSIQTNATLITDAHIEIFKRYQVHVGISVDGPGELNELRWHGNKRSTTTFTQRSLDAINRLCNAGLTPSLIVTLHRSNASRGRLPTLMNWFLELDNLGIRQARLHLLEAETDEIRTDYALTTEENVRALLAIASLQPMLNSLKFDLFADMYNMMTFRDNLASCVWNACDPYSTQAVRGIEGDGHRSNCGRTNKEGVGFLKADTIGYERQLALWNTSQDHGGCNGCRFFLVCKGQCPGTAIGGDWRNRTEHCGVWMALYERLEREMVGVGEIPVSLHPSREAIESLVVDGWARGENIHLLDALRLVEGESGLGCMRSDCPVQYWSAPNRQRTENS